MKRKISKSEKIILQMNNRNNYDTYRCDDHGIYQIRKDILDKQHICPCCRKKYIKLTDEQIEELLK